MLTDKVAVIAGGAGEVGNAAVQRFLAEGALVASWDLRCDDSRDDRLLTRRIDLRDLAAVEQAMDDVVATFGRVDILVNNAGVMVPYTELLSLEPDQWSEANDSNLRSAVNCAQAAASHFKAQGSGRIINVTSVMALHGYPGQTSYIATKSALIGLTKTWARELGPWGITVNAVSPGYIRCRASEANPQQVVEDVIFRTPLHRLGEPSDVAAAFAWLASDDASFVTGTVLRVDGGWVP